jgi:molybdenum cofactor cytidylyltransferase
MTSAALILAAGASTRLGQPKQLLRIDDETLLDRSVRIAREAECSPIVVVLGAFEENIRRDCKLQDAIVITHANWAEGMSSSLARGMESLQDSSGVTIMTCDMLAITAKHLRALRTAGEVTASSYAGRNGVPAYFPQALFPELLKLYGDMGARELLRSAKSVELAGGELDIDTADDLLLAMNSLRLRKTDFAQ